MPHALLTLRLCDDRLARGGRGMQPPIGDHTDPHNQHKQRQERRQLQAAAKVKLHRAQARQAHCPETWWAASPAVCGADG